MDLIPVRTSLDLISKKLEKLSSRREKVLKDSKAIISEASKAIVRIHVQDLKGAELHLKVAMASLRESRSGATKELERYYISPEAELVEASILLSLEIDQRIPSLKELKVSEVSYLFGLLDAIGELKRRIYDAIRLGRSRQAYSYFKLMEEIYLMLLPLAVYDGVAAGLRRKLDIARAVVEGTRSAVFEEIRRSDLIKAMKRLTVEERVIRRKSKKVG